VTCLVPTSDFLGRLHVNLAFGLLPIIETTTSGISASWLVLQTGWLPFVYLRSHLRRRFSSRILSSSGIYGSYWSATAHLDSDTTKYSMMLLPKFTPSGLFGIINLLVKYLSESGTAVIASDGSFAGSYIKTMYRCTVLKSVSQLSGCGHVSCSASWFILGNSGLISALEVPQTILIPQEVVN